MPPRAAPSSIPRSITVAGRTLSLDAVKHALIAWCVVRVLSSGFFGRAVTAVAAGCLAYGARALPGLVPAPLADSLKKLDAFTATADNRLYLSLAIDAVGALTAFEPKMLRALVGGAGWGPVSTFLVGFIYQVPPLTAVSAFEESGYIPWFKLVPTATLGWLIHQKFIDEAGLRAGIKSVARTFGLA